ncbi:MAG TPA: DUF1015 domain-containing protein [Acidimicrobiia bacterium]|nr:DUF1015 domain-containing protein [Acidimicrobiia bacterium]
MPDFLPFPGIRYDLATVGTDLGPLVAPPYDVIDDELCRSLEAAHEQNAVRVILPRDHEREGDRYERAAATFAAWEASGVLRRDDHPRFYTYRMEFRDTHGVDRHTTGVLGALVLPTADDGSVLPHERTLPKAKSDRLALLRAMRTNVDPIWGLSTTDGLTALLDGAEPLSSCTDVDGVRHHLGAVPDARVDAVRAAVGAGPLVLADGHHRYETAHAYRNEVAAAGRDTAGADAIMTFVVELADDQLCIEPIHRLLTVPAGVDVRALLADAFVVTDAGPNTPEGVDALEDRMRADGGVGLVDDRGIALLVARPEIATAALASEPEPVRSTDAALVEAVVVPRLPQATFEYRHDAHAVAALVDKGNASAGVLLRPVSVADTRAAAMAGLRMPQKTTFFTPKPRTGMVFRRLD